jgi:hypothetical protein
MITKEVYESIKLNLLERKNERNLYITGKFKVCDSSGKYLYNMMNTLSKKVKFEDK